MKYLLLMIMSVIAITSANALEVEQLDTRITKSAIFVKQTEIPTVNILLSFKAGTVLEGNYPHGTSNLMANMLMQGTTTKTAQQISKELGELASNISVYSSRNTLNIEISSLEENIEPTLAILQDILVNANYPNKEFTIVKDSISQALRQQQENPNVLAVLKARKEFYGEDNVKAYISSLGTETSLSQLTPEHLQAYHKEYLTKQNMAINVVSSIDKEKIEELLNKYLITMYNGSRKTLITPVPVGKTNRSIIQKDMPQTTVLLYTGAFNRNNPDYYTSVIFNYILGGGGFSSRLMEEIREKRGLTYGVRSSFEYDLPYVGLFMISLQTSNKNAYKTESLIRKELDRISKKGITEQELEAAKGFLIGSFPMRLRTSDKLLSNLNMIQEFNFPLDYLDNWAEKIDAITVEDVNNFAAKFIKDDVSFSRVFVGGVN